MLWTGYSVIMLQSASEKEYISRDSLSSFLRFTSIRDWLPRNYPSVSECIEVNIETQSIGSCFTLHSKQGAASSEIGSLDTYADCVVPSSRPTQHLTILSQL